MKKLKRTYLRSGRVIGADPELGDGPVSGTGPAHADPGRRAGLEL